LHLKQQCGGQYQGEGIDAAKRAKKSSAQISKITGRRNTASHTRSCAARQMLHWLQYRALARHRR